MSTSEIIKSILNFLFLSFLFTLLYTYTDDGTFGINSRYIMKAMISALGPIVISTIIVLKSRKKNKKNMPK
jgi:hypothetical protein